MRRLPREVWWLLSITLVMAVVALALSNHTSKSAAGHYNAAHDTYNSGTGGLRALYLTLEQVGYSVRRWRRPYAGHDLPAGALLIVSPTTPIAPLEWRTLHRWVSEGNTLILCSEYLRPGDSQSVELRESFPGEESTQEASPSQPSYLAQGVSHLRVDSGASLSPPALLPKESKRAAKKRASPFEQTPEISPEWQRATAQAVPVFADQDGIVVSYAHVGRGNLVLMSSPWSLSNEGLGKADNLAFVLNALGARGPVYFDEYHHGYGENVAWAMVPAVGKVALAQLLLAFFVLVYARSRRFGRIVPLLRGSRERSEFLGTMTVVLRRGEATRLALRTAYDATMRRLRRQLGLPEEATPEEVGRAAARIDAARAARLQTALEHCQELIDRKERVPEARALTAVRELDEAERALPRI